MSSHGTPIPMTARKAGPLSGTADVMHAGDVSRDGKTAVAGGEDGVLRVWNIADGKSLQSFDPPKDEDGDDLTSK